MSDRFDHAVTELSMAWRSGEQERIAAARTALEVVYAEEKWGAVDAAVERLTRERDEARAEAQVHFSVCSYRPRMQTAEAERDALAARVAEAEYMLRNMDGIGRGTGACVECGGLEAHVPGCRLAAFLRGDR